MAMRRSFRRRTFRAKGKDYIWVTAIAGFNITENTQSNAFLSAGDWEANSLSFERATLLRIRGYVAYTQTAVSTATSPPPMAAAIHVAPLTFSAGDFDPFVSSDYDANDVIWTAGTMTTGGSVANTQESSWTHMLPIDVKAKRRMNSSEQLVFTMGMGIDAGLTPSAAIFFVLRSLVNRA